MRNVSQTAIAKRHEDLQIAGSQIYERMRDECASDFARTRYAWLDKLTQRFGFRGTSAGGAVIAFVGTLPLLYLSSQHCNVSILAITLFIRGVGMSAVGVPPISAVYSSVRTEELPMATTSLNIAQRLGGAAPTTLCAMVLGWRFAAVPPQGTVASAFTVSFVLLCGLHALLILAAVRLPLSLQTSGHDLGRAGLKLKSV
jgi:MFS family permease